jgi:integrase
MATFKFTKHFVNTLRFDKVPLEQNRYGEITTRPNIPPKEYTVFDAYRNPQGLFIRVRKTCQTYNIQVRIGGKIFKKVVGDLETMTIEQAQTKAKRIISELLETFDNSPDAIRKRTAQTQTFLSAATVYKRHLKTRPTPAVENSLKNFDQAMRRLAPLFKKRLKTITGPELEELFLQILNSNPEGKKPFRTAAEQTMTWGSRIFQYAITLERHLSKTEDRQPVLTYDPFIYLRDIGAIRSKQELERDYKKNNVRNPLSVTEDGLGNFLATLEQRRKHALYRTGCDYILTTLLLGLRSIEASQLQWWDRVPPTLRNNCGWVNLDDQTIYIHTTKNQQSYLLPMGQTTYAILLARHQRRDKNSSWVFPARSNRSEKGNYKSASALFKSIATASGNSLTRPHDLRRTYGRIIDKKSTPYFTMKALLNHLPSGDVTFKYAESEVSTLKEYIEKAEATIFGKNAEFHQDLLKILTTTNPTEQEANKNTSPKMRVRVHALLN